MHCVALKAQQKHFIYVQSEDRQPFAVVLGGKVYSSSDYGYVIIPKLTDSTYKFTVSFPMNKYSDQYFTCTVNKKDVGYTLKNATGGWALQNLQTQKLLMNGAATTSSAFGEMLSDVTNDSTLTKNSVVQKPVDTSTNNTAIVGAAVVAAPASNLATDSLQQPQKIAEEKLDTGTNMLFVDKTQTGVDTINVFVPNETNNSNVQQQAANGSAVINVPGVTFASINNDSSITQSDSSASKQVVSNSNEALDTTAHAASNPFYQPENNLANTVVAANTLAVIETMPGLSNATKQDCGNMISDEDLNKLKRKMFVQSNNTNMIQYAVKFMNKKCISTIQVKELGNLFSSDDGRYSLYDALYNFTYDYGNYPSLANQILDPYYKKRFAAMLR